MKPHILIDTELLHIFNTDEDRDKLCIDIADVIQCVVRVERASHTQNMQRDVYGLKTVAGYDLDSLCERISPKLTAMTQSYIEASSYSNKIIVDVQVTRNVVAVYLSAKYYTGLSSSLH